MINELKNGGCYGKYIRFYKNMGNNKKNWMIFLILPIIFVIEFNLHIFDSSTEI